VGSSKASSDDAVGLAAPCTTATFIPLLLHEDGSIQGKTPEIDFDCLNSQLCVEDLSVREATTGHEVHITCDTWWKQVNAITSYKFLQLQQLFIMFRSLPHQNYNCHGKKLNCEGSFWVEILVPSKEWSKSPFLPAGASPRTRNASSHRAAPKCVSLRFPMRCRISIGCDLILLIG
jgi:hypothetical protein